MMYLHSSIFLVDIFAILHLMQRLQFHGYGTFVHVQRDGLTYASGSLSGWQSGRAAGGHSNSQRSNHSNYRRERSRAIYTSGPDAPATTAAAATYAENETQTETQTAGFLLTGAPNYSATAPVSNSAPTASPD